MNDFSCARVAHVFHLSQFGYTGNESESLACMVNFIAKAHDDLNF